MAVKREFEVITEDYPGDGFALDMLSWQEKLVYAEGLRDYDQLMGIKIMYGDDIEYCNWQDEIFEKNHPGFTAVRRRVLCIVWGIRSDDHRLTRSSQSPPNHTRQVLF